MSTVERQRVVRADGRAISEDDRHATGRPRELAGAMGSTCVRLADLDETSVLHVIRDVS
jgi:hypothetical protein